MSNWLAYTGAVLTGLVPHLVMYLIGSQKKVMGYAVSKNEAVINIRHPDIDKRLSVTLDGKPLNDCRVLVIILHNLGMKDIESQAVHLTFPAGATVLHAHCSSSTLAIGPKIEAVEHDSYSVNIPLMNPGDQLVVRLLMTNHECGKFLIAAKGPNLKFRLFDPATFISPGSEPKPPCPQRRHLHLDSLGLYRDRPFHGEAILGKNDYLDTDCPVSRVAFSGSGLSGNRPVDKKSVAMERESTGHPAADFRSLLNCDLPRKELTHEFPSPSSCVTTQCHRRV